MKKLINNRPLMSLLCMLAITSFPATLHAGPLDSWTSRTSGTTNNLYGATFGNGTFAVVGGPGTLLTSPDGMSWTSRNTGNTNVGAGITFNGATWVTTGFGGVILTSTNLNSWAQQKSGTTNLLREVYYANGTFVIAGRVGTILTSTDATNWSLRSSGTTNDVQGVAYANGTFVVVGKNGVILTSPTGVTWTSRSSGTLGDLTGIAYGNGLFVASGNVAMSGGSTILTSPDGVTWTSQNSGAPNELSGVSFGAGFFVAVGSAGGPDQLIYSSPDGINWTPRISGSGPSLYRSAYGAGTFVTVGNSGTILQSGDIASTQAVFPIATNANIVELSSGAAFSGSNYLVAVLAGTNAGVQLISTNGTAIGSLLNVGVSLANNNPLDVQVAFGGGNYLAVWLNAFANDWHAQIISSGGAAVGPQLSYGNTVSRTQALLSDGTNFLMTWQDSSGPYYGQFLTSAGVLSGTAFVISSAPHDLAGAFGGGKYLFVWQDGAPLNTYGAFVSAGGSVGAPFQISETSSLDNNPPAVAFDGANFFVVWNTDTTENANGRPNWSLYGRLVSPAGAFPGGELLLNTNQPVLPSLAFDGANYLLSWTSNLDATNSKITMSGQFFNGSGTPVGASFPLFSPQGTTSPLYGKLLFDGTKFLAVADIGTASVSGNGDINGFLTAAVYGGFIPASAGSYQIYGYVTDNLGNPVAGVDVSANDGGGNVYSATTDGSGYYSINVGAMEAGMSVWIAAN